MTMAEFVSIMGLAVAVAELLATLKPGRRVILLTGAVVLAVLSVVTLYTSLAHRREVKEAREAMLSAFENEPRTYDELRQDLYDIKGPVFDAGLEEGRRSGQIGFRVLNVKTSTGEIHSVRGYFKMPDAANN